MKKYILITLFLAGTIVAALSCKKSFTVRNPYQLADANMAYLKIVHASPNFGTIWGKPDSFNIFINGAKVNGTFLSYNGVFPTAVYQASPGIANTYFAVQPGAVQIKLTVPGTGANTDSLAIMSVTKNLVGGKLYSYILTDSIKAVRDSAQMFVQDNFTSALPGYVNLRFAHAVLNDTAGTTVDVFSYARNTTIFTKIKPDSVTSFQLLGFNIQSLDTFYATRTPATSSTPLSGRTILAKMIFTGNAILSNPSAPAQGAANLRTFTLYYKGDGNLTSGTRARALTSYINQ